VAQPENVPAQAGIAVNRTSIVVWVLLGWRVWEPRLGLSYGTTGTERSGEPKREGRRSTRDVHTHPPPLPGSTAYQPHRPGAQEHHGSKYRVMNSSAGSPIGAPGGASGERGALSAA